MYNRISNFRVQKKKRFEFAFSNRNERKQNNGPIAPKIINELPTPTKQLLETEVLSKPKNRKDYQNREIYEFEQAPLYFEKSVLDQTPPIAPAPKYRMTSKTIEIKKEVGIDKPDGTTTKNVMDSSVKKVIDAKTAARAAKRRKRENKFCKNS